MIYINEQDAEVTDFLLIREDDGGKRVNNDGYNQGGSNVHIVIEKWLENVKNKLDI